jgi:hypothetical protein
MRKSRPMTTLSTSVVTRLLMRPWSADEGRMRSACSKTRCVSTARARTSDAVWRAATVTVRDGRKRGRDGSRRQRVRLERAAERRTVMNMYHCWHSEPRNGPQKSSAIQTHGRTNAPSPSVSMYLRRGASATGRQRRGSESKGGIANSTTLSCRRRPQTRREYAERREGRRKETRTKKENEQRNVPQQAVDGEWREERRTDAADEQ